MRGTLSELNFWKVFFQRVLFLGLINKVLVYDFPQHSIIMSS